MTKITLETIKDHFASERAMLEVIKQDYLVQKGDPDSIKRRKEVLEWFNERLNKRGLHDGILQKLFKICQPGIVRAIKMEEK